MDEFPHIPPKLRFLLLDKEGNSIVFLLRIAKRLVNHRTYTGLYILLYKVV